MGHPTIMAAEKAFAESTHAVVQAATGDALKPFSDRQMDSRKGGLRGGANRPASLTPEQRTELALKAVAARKAPASSKAGAGQVKKAAR